MELAFKYYLWSKPRLLFLKSLKGQAIMNVQFIEPKKGKSHGYELSKDTQLYLCYVKDALQVGRQKECTPEVEDEVIKIISPLNNTLAFYTTNC
jgi:hypothetical protein